ncbi:MAG: hypothetical protein KIIPBIDF_01469 [Candidatus Methanoperedenaceae archaeon GB50]|nr:MAG: hypothetical protein KIIPBIDF_01469 [Candidatus Methanoperedenaceae archaeon GB50]
MRLNHDLLIKVYKESYWTPSRLDLCSWFQRNAPSLGELYKGSVQMLFGEKIPGRIRFVAHAVREIRNRLPDILSGMVSGPVLQYKNRLDDIATDWEKAGLPINGSLPISINSEEKLGLLNSRVYLPIELYRKISILIKDHIRTRQTPEDKAIQLFEALAPENQNMRNQLRPVVKQWLAVTEWFVRKAHDSGKTEDEFDIEEFIKKFELFEKILYTLIRPFFENLEELDEILEEANT